MAKDEENVEEGTEEKEKKPKKDSNLVPLLITIIVVLIIQAGIAFGVVFGLSDKEDPVTTEAPDTTGSGDLSNVTVVNEKIFPETFELVVNIAGTDGMRFLKVGISLAYDFDNPGNKNFLIEYQGNLVRIRSYIVQYLSSLNLEQVNDMSAQQNIRRDLLRELNRVIPPNSGEFSNVYITEYIIQ